MHLQPKSQFGNFRVRWLSHLHCHIQDSRADQRAFYMKRGKVLTQLKVETVQIGVSNSSSLR